MFLDFHSPKKNPKYNFRKGASMLKKHSFIMMVLWVLCFSGVAFGAVPFHEGKTIRIIVGFSAGGGFDAYARVIARHFGKHIAGSPKVIVENMTGAGSLVSANHLYKVAKPDGLTIGHFNGGLFFNQVLGQPGIEFDAKKFGFIGAAAKEECVCILSKASGVMTVNRWVDSKVPVKLGGLGPGANIDNSIRILKASSGLPIQLVSGYKGTADIRLAVESGELQGACWGWETIRTTWRSALQSGDVVPVLQMVEKPFPDLASVPLAINLAKTNEGRQMIEVGVHNPSIFSRPFVLPPGIPKDQLEVFRNAFQEMFKDPDFIAEIEKTKLDIAPVTGEELERRVGRLFELDSAFLNKMKDILYK
jgi:tripartite-type tricarboxylate transporter receptor subunit TctC